MRVVVAGATGVVGRRLVPLLTGAGHEVVALSRRVPAGAPAPSVTPVAVDALDAPALREAVLTARPDAVVHLLTAIPQAIDPRRMARDFAVTNRLRDEATRTLLDAARESGAGRVVCQGLAYAYDPDPTGSAGPVAPADEDAPLWRDVPGEWRTSIEALTSLEQTTGAAGGLVLRVGHLYGPGTAYADDGDTVRQVRARAMPVVGDGGAVFSFVHVDDAAAAFHAAVQAQATGVLNVVDDDPAPVREWLPELARILAAPAPRRVPTALARLVAGSWGVAYMTRLRGADNTRARQQLDWSPRYSSWRFGFAADLGARAPVR